MNDSLLEDAVRYSLSALDSIRPEDMCRPTPCAGWDLHMLLTHMCASVDALHEGVACGRVLLFPSDDEPFADPVAELHTRIVRLVDDWAASGGPTRVAVGGVSVPPSVLTGVAAIELAVHGWDIAQTIAGGNAMPWSLADDLLDLSRMLLAGNNRRGLFAPAIQLAHPAGPDEELLAFLGRVEVRA